MLEHLVSTIEHKSFDALAIFSSGIFGSFLHPFNLIGMTTGFASGYAPNLYGMVSSLALPVLPRLFEAATASSVTVNDVMDDIYLSFVLSNASILAGSCAFLIKNRHQHRPSYILTSPDRQLPEPLPEPLLAPENPLPKDSFFAKIAQQLPSFSFKPILSRAVEAVDPLLGIGAAWSAYQLSKPAAIASSLITERNEHLMSPLSIEQFLTGSMMLNVLTGYLERPYHHIATWGSLLGVPAYTFSQLFFNSDYTLTDFSADTFKIGTAALGMHLAGRALREGKESFVKKHKL